MYSVLSIPYWTPFLVSHFESRSILQRAEPRLGAREKSSLFRCGFTALIIFNFDLNQI